MICWQSLQCPLQEDHKKVSAVSIPHQADEFDPIYTCKS